MSVIDWMTRQNLLARSLEEQERQRQEFPNKMREMDTTDALRQQLMRQSGEAFPTQLEQAQFSLAKEKENLPYQQFERNAKMSPYGAAEKFLQDEPELANQLWASAPEAQGGDAVGPPDLRGTARRTAQNIFTEQQKASAAGNMANTMYPFQEALTNLLGQWRVKEAEAGRIDRSDDLRRKLEAGALGSASQLITTSPGYQQYMALQSALPNVSTREQAVTMMKQMSGISAQLDAAGKNAMATAMGMEGNPAALQRLIEANIYTLQRNLQRQYQELLSKYFTNAPPGFGSRVGGAVDSAARATGFMAPENTEGYTP